MGVDMLNRQFTEELIGMVLDTEPTEEQLIYLLTGWRNYFNITLLDSEEQLQRFHDIVRQRLSRGDTSLLAPYQKQGE